MALSRLFAIFLAVATFSLLSIPAVLAQPPDDGQGQGQQPRGRRGGGAFGQGMFGPGGFGQGMFGQGGFGQGMFGQGMFGQGGPGRGGRGSGMMGSPGDPFQLLKNEAVRKELKLSKKQIAQTDKLVESYQNDGREQMQQSRLDPADLEEMSDEDRSKALQKARDQQEKTIKKLNDKYRPKISKILKPDQEKRLKQISWQVAGVAALRGDDMAKALKLSKDQRTTIDDAFEESGRQMRDSFRPPDGGRRPRQANDQANDQGDPAAGDDGGGNGGAPFGFGAGGPFGQGGQGRGGPPTDFRERFENMRKMGEDRDAKVLAVLTDKQRTQYEQLKGEPFDVSQLRPRWGRGRGGPPSAGDQADRGGNPPQGQGRGAGRRRGQDDSQ